MMGVGRALGMTSRATGRLPVEQPPMAEFSTARAEMANPQVETDERARLLIMHAAAHAAGLVGQEV
jgi:hypothetical protein